MSTFLNSRTRIAAMVAALLAGSSLAAAQVLDNAPIGGLQLDVEPRGAQVYVDGVRAGVVSEFSGYYKHLRIASGEHVITLIAPRYEPLIISIVVIPGHTITYRGTLNRANGS